MKYKIPTKELIEEIQRVGEQVGHPPAMREMNELGEYSPTTFRNRFGAWSTALGEAGFEPREQKHFPDEDLIRELWRVDREYTSPPKYREMDEYGAYCTSTYENRFGSWNEALQAAGLDTRIRGEWNVSGEDHPRWKGEPDPYYGADWGEKREKALERDGHKCTVPGCEVTSEKSKERFDSGLHVHHIERIENFREDGEIDYESANSLSNLVTLCAVHHTEYEWLPLDIREIATTSE